MSIQTRHDAGAGAFKRNKRLQILLMLLGATSAAACDVGSFLGPGPAGAQQGGPNEPAGLTAVSASHAFNSIEEDGWQGGVGDMSIMVDSSAPFSPPNVGRVLFRAGEVAGGSLRPIVHRLTGWSSTEVYTSFWFKVSDNWQGHDSGTSKIFYLTENGTGNPIYYRLHGSGETPLTFSVQRQTTGAGWWDPPEGSQRSYAWNSSDNEIDGITFEDARVYRGEWVHVEVYVVCNTPGTYDGEIHWWLNGKKVGQWTSARFMTEGGEFELTSFRWEPIWGGQKGTVEADMYQFMDHIYVSSR